jgi:hypothetical protein
MKPQKKWRPCLIERLNQDLKILSPILRFKAQRIKGATSKIYWYYLKVHYNLIHKKPKTYLKELYKLRWEGINVK